MEPNAFANELFSCFVGGTGDTKSGKVRRIGAPTGGGFLEDDGIFFHGLIL